MIQPHIEQALRAQLDRLEVEQQRQVLAFARAMAEQQPVGRAGEMYRAFAGGISSEDLMQMKDAIEEGCEQVDADDW